MDLVSLISIITDRKVAIYSDNAATIGESGDGLPEPVTRGDLVSSPPCCVAVEPFPEFDCVLRVLRDQPLQGTSSTA